MNCVYCGRAVGHEPWCQAPKGTSVVQTDTTAPPSNELIQAAKDFRQRLIDRQQDMSPEFAEVLHDKFWELI